MNVRRLGVWTNLLISAVLALLVWVLLVWVASRPGLRALIDLTPQRVNSVDPVTVELLRSLRDEGAEVEFHLFRQQLGGQARNEAEAQALAIRGRLLELTRMLLRRYVAIGGENVKSFDHAPFEDTAAYREAAQAFAYTAADNEALVVAVRQQGKERRFRKLSLISDLAVIEMPQQGQSPVKRALVPILKDYEGEKAISSALKGLLVQGNPIAYVLKGYSSTVDFGDTSAVGYGQLIDALVRSGFEVRELQLRQAGGVPADASLVMVLEPNRDFLSRDADALYEYMRRGGRVFINYAWSAIDDMNPTGGRFGELLGYELSRQPVFHKIPSPTPGGPSLDGTGEVANLGMRANPLHPTTRRLAESGRPLQVYLARALRQSEGAPANVRREALLSTGDEGWLAVDGPDGQPDYRAPNVRLQSYIVAMACEVDVDDTGGKRPPGAPRTGQAVIVSGAFCNNAGMRFFGDFALNICNWMAERKVLLDIEGAHYEVRSLEVKPQQMERVWSLLVLWVPDTFLVFGLIVWWRRRH
ncbi:MAG: Gldg family protein [Planctomycetes bacterium]|nr:Gldg family protein [Planctomycetota bacterium]